MKFLCVIVVGLSNDDAQPYKYTGKELERMDGFNSYDYGARLYLPDICRWTTIDPLAEKYYNISPYAFCHNNPVNYVDNLGKSPIYSNNGLFLGTDDKGISGSYIIIDKKFFKQGMPHSQAQKNLYLGNISPNSYRKIWRHHANLVNRPDFDGYVTISEGIKWAKDHPNALKNPTPDNTLYIDASKLDFGSLSTSDFAKVGEKTKINLFSSCKFFRILKSAFFYSERNTVYALGRVDMVLINQEQREVKIVNNSATDYDWNTGGETLRDYMIKLERKRAGLNDTHGFKVFYYGSGHLKK